MRGKGCLLKGISGEASQLKSGWRLGKRMMAGGESNLPSPPLPSPPSPPPPPHTHTPHLPPPLSCLQVVRSGRKLRLSLGMEMITNPSILFLDEPTSRLDIYTAYKVGHGAGGSRGPGGQGGPGGENTAYKVCV